MQLAVRHLALAAAALALASCIAVPKQLEGEFADISPARVEPAVYGQAVRWGGVIISARNEPNRTCFEILSRELESHLRPSLEDRTAGRFIACKDGFYDPEVFANGREVTLTGRIQGVEQRKVEEFDYRYPVVEIDQLVLWEERQDIVVYPGYYDPFWYPYFWGHPYWGYYWGYYPYYHYPHPYPHSGRSYIHKSIPGPVQTEPDRN
jgi:outer membrane lipoprotein